MMRVAPPSARRRTRVVPARDVPRTLVVPPRARPQVLVVPARDGPEILVVPAKAETQCRCLGTTLDARRGGNDDVSNVVAPLRDPTYRRVP